MDIPRDVDRYNFSRSHPLDGKDYYERLIGRRSDFAVAVCCTIYATFERFNSRQQRIFNSRVRDYFLNRK